MVRTAGSTLTFATGRPLSRRSATLDQRVWILGGLFLALAILVQVGVLTGLDQWAVDHVMPALRPRSVPRSAGTSVFPIFHVRRGMDLPVAAAAYGVAWIAAALPALVLTAIGCLYLQRRGHSGLAVRFALVFVAVNVLVLVGKSVIGRPALYGTDPKGVRVHVLPFDTSFPSGHASRAVILVALVSLCVPRFRVLAVVWLAAVLVLLVLGAWHTPSDVLGAALLAGAFVIPLLQDRDRLPPRARADAHAEEPGRGLQ
jgi:membrane-associated phospholipid phosphatase